MTLINIFEKEMSIGQSKEYAGKWLIIDVTCLIVIVLSETLPCVTLVMNIGGASEDAGGRDAIGGEAPANYRVALSQAAIVFLLSDCK